MCFEKSASGSTGYAGTTAGGSLSNAFAFATGYARASAATGYDLTPPPPPVMRSAGQGPEVRCLGPSHRRWRFSARSWPATWAHGGGAQATPLRAS